MKILEVQRISLGKLADTSNAQAFMIDFNKLSTINPLNTRNRILLDTIFELSIDKNNGRIHIHDIRSIYPGHGAGTNAMKHLLALADRHQVDLEGYAFSYDSNSRNKSKKLASWYSRLGFSVGGKEDDGGYRILYHHQSTLKEDVQQKEKVQDHPYLYHLTDYVGFSHSINTNQLNALRQRGISTTFNENIHYIGGRFHYHFKFVLDGKKILSNYNTSYYRSFAQIAGTGKKHEYKEDEVRIDSSSVSPLSDYVLGVHILVRIMSRSFIQWMFYKIDSTAYFADMPRSSAPSGIYSLKKIAIDMKKPLFVLDANKIRKLNKIENDFLNDCYLLAEQKSDFDTALFELTKKYNILGHDLKPIKHAAVIRSRHSKKIENTINQLLTSTPINKIHKTAIKKTVQSLIKLLGYSNQETSEIIDILESNGLIDPLVPPVDWLRIFSDLILDDRDELLDNIRYFRTELEKRKKFTSDLFDIMSGTHTKSMITSV